LSDSKIMLKTVESLLMPTLRCFWSGRFGGGTPCARPAVALRPGRVMEMPMLICARHRRDGDVDLDPAQPFRRLRVSMTVDVAATAWNESIAQNQAVFDLEAALQPLGAIVNVIGITTTIVRPGAQAAEPEAPREGVGG
jgi:hypothetical protein